MMFLKKINENKQLLFQEISINQYGSEHSNLQSFSEYDFLQIRYIFNGYKLSRTMFIIKIVPMKKYLRSKYSCIYIQSLKDEYFLARLIRNDGGSDRYKIDGYDGLKDFYKNKITHA